MSVSNIVSAAERTGLIGDKESLREVLDFLVTEEQLGVTLVSAAIENAPGTDSEAFLPVLSNGVTTEYHHVEALKEAGGRPLTTRYWFPDAALDNGGIGVFETLEVIETILELTGADPSLISHVADRPGHDRRYSLDSARIQELGWRRTHSLEEGLSETVAWYAERRDWWEPIKSGDYRQYYEQQYGARLSG